MLVLAGFMLFFGTINTLTTKFQVSYRARENHQPLGTGMAGLSTRSEQSPAVAWLRPAALRIGIWYAKASAGSLVMTARERAVSPPSARHRGTARVAHTPSARNARPPHAPSRQGGGEARGAAGGALCHVGRSCARSIHAVRTAVWPPGLGSKYTQHSA